MVLPIHPATQTAIVIFSANGGTTAVSLSNPTLKLLKREFSHRFSKENFPPVKQSTFIRQALRGRSVSDYALTKVSHLEALCGRSSA